LPHNDGSTRGLWSAAGELSSLFGSETVPTRHTLTENGVAFDRVAKHYPGGSGELLERETEAWGWRALVHTEPRPLIAGDVLLADIAPALREQLLWGLGESLQILGQEQNAIAQQLLRWTDEYSQENPTATLSDLYQFLTPKLWSLVRGSGNCNLQTTSSLQLFRFNSATCSLPRFASSICFCSLPRAKQRAAATMTLCVVAASTNCRNSATVPCPSMSFCRDADAALCACTTARFTSKPKNRLLFVPVAIVIPSRIWPPHSRRNLAPMSPSSEKPWPSSR
jgi:hypothetical protein